MLNADYIVGLVDGEGSFTFHVKDPETGRRVKRRAKAEPRFYLKLVEKDKEVLDGLKAYFGCGNVYFQKDTRPNHQNCYRYEVAGRDDLRKTIIPFFLKHRLQFPSKRNDFEIFRKLMKMVAAGVHLTDSGLREMRELQKKMH